MRHKFPEFRGELPERLSPWKLPHYSRLAYWVYFRPTAFHCYLHQADPDAYRLTGYRKFFRTWQVPAYRNLYLMLPLAIALPAILAGLAVFMYTQGIIQSNVAWTTSISVTPDGQLAVLASGERDFDIKSLSADSTLKVWDLKKGSQRHILLGHQEGVTAVAVTPDGQKAVSASRDRTLKIWDIQRGKELQTLKGHQDWVSGVAISPNGKRAISTSADKTLRVWDIEQGKELHTLTGHTDVVWAVAVTPDSQRAVSASADQTLKVWDIEQGKELYTLEGHRAWVTGVTLTPDGRQAISASIDQTLKVWDIEQGQELRTLTGHKNWVTGVTLSPDGQRLVSASADQTLKVWDIQQGQELYTLTGHNGWVTNVAVTPDGQQAVSASSDHSLKVWDLQKGKLVHTLTGHRSWITAIAMLPNTAQILSASFDRYPKLWNLQRGTEVLMTGEITKAVGYNLGFSTVFTAALISTIIGAGIILAVGVMAFGVAGGIMSSFIISLAASPVCAFAFLVVDRIASNPLFKNASNAAQQSALLTAIFGILFGLFVGVTFGLTNRRALSVFASIVFILVIGVAVGIVVACALTPTISFKGRLLPGIRAGMAVSIGFNLLVAIGALRLPFYPVQLLLALFSRFRGKQHPARWDELLVLPVPGTQALLRSHLRTSELEQRKAEGRGQRAEGIYPDSVTRSDSDVGASAVASLPYPSGTPSGNGNDFVQRASADGTSHLATAHEQGSQSPSERNLLPSASCPLPLPSVGLQLIADVVRNPFQRMFAQRALHQHLHSVAAPLNFLYYLLTSPDLNTYVVAPINQLDWQILPTTKQVLLGELANRRVNFSSDDIDQLAENVVSGLTWLGRNRKQTPLTRFAGMLYELSYTKLVEAEDFNLSSYEKTYAGLTQYPDGTEIADSFEALATFLRYDKLSDLTTTSDVVSGLSANEVSIRPNLLAALTRCGEIGKEVRRYQAATTSVEQLATLARLTSSLDSLDEYVVEQVVSPEQAILRRIIRQWRRLVNEAVVSIDKSM